MAQPGAPRALAVSEEQAADEIRRAQADGWRVEGSEYLGRARWLFHTAHRPR